MADTGSDGFITLPPGIFDPKTLPVAPKPERQRTERDDIVFVPMTPGMPAPPVVDAAPAPAVTVTPPAPAASAPPAVPAPRWTLVLADGSEAPVHTALLLGRNPAPFASWPQAQLLAVADTTQSVSKTHVAFEVDDSGLWVHDLNSTNGVWVVNGTDVTEVSPGRRVNVPAGASIELGDYVLTVRR